MTIAERPSYLAASAWSTWAEVTVELGRVGSWAPSGPAWGVGAWGVDQWGSGYLTADFRDVTVHVISLDVDTARQGIDDPGEVGTLSLVLDDRTGELGIAGSKERAGNLIRVSTKHTASSTWRPVFYGKVIEALADESLSAPTLTIRAVDMLGSVLSTDDAEPLPAQSVRERLDELLDRATFPVTLRVLDADTTRLLAVDTRGSRLDAARGAVSSSVGGTLFAQGDGTIRYVHGETNVPPDAVPVYLIGTIEGSICPTSLALGEKIANIVNFYDWTNADQNDASKLRTVQSAPDSIHHYGRAASVRTDLLNADADELAGLVHSELARTAWASDSIDGVAFTVHDDESGSLAIARIGDLCSFDYTGADPWSAWLVIGRIAHHISPDEWTIELGAYPPVVAALWGSARWGIDTWAE